MAPRISREIASNIRSSIFYTIMADETADVSNKELVICICWVDEDLIAHEDFIGMHPTERTTADVIVHVLKVLANSVKKSKHIIWQAVCSNIQ